MKDIEIIEGNKLIAEFMGLKVLGKPHEGAVSPTELLPSDITNNTFMNFVYSKIESESWYCYPEFNTSWDWLMPVVEKINKICQERGGELANHSRDQEFLPNPLDNPLHWKSWSYHIIHLSTDINNVWMAVVEFINWYNKNK